MATLTTYLHGHAHGGCAALCCTVLCCAVLCCAVLCCAVLCCAVLRCDALHCAVLLLRQENLFFGRTISRMFDLKGAQRTRGDADGDEGATVLDENLFRFNDGFPLLLSELAKQQVL